MEQEEFTSDILQDQLFCVKQGFQDDKFLKKNNYLNIPDTIPENSSVELSENSLKMEAPPALKESIVREDKDNMKGNQSVRSDESSSSGTIIAVDNSFIINCERKLLESSSSDEKTIGSANLSIESGFFGEIPRKLGLVNNTISTPPSVLRKQISILTSEMAEAHEFHDLELQVLKEDKCINEGDLETNLQWVEKYAVLMDLYTSLKNEFDQYRREQENLQYKAADCLENLCSQIEASDSSLNFSTASFISFNTEVKSSTMLENVSEVEATVVHDGTVLVNDPLSITNDMPFRTPTSSAKKLFPQGSSATKEKPAIREIKNLKDLIAKHETTTPFNSDYNLQLLDVETKLYDKMKELRDLEQRLFKVEDFSSVLQNEHERIASGLVRENNALKENISKKSEELDELTQKLFTEIIALKPSLKDSLGDAPGSKLLPVFIETIMESCKSVQDELVKKYSNEKTEWETQKKVEMTTIENLENQIKSLNEQLFTQEMKVKEFEELKGMYDSLKEKMSETESLIITREEEIRILQSHDSNIRRTREELASAKETIMALEAQILSFESEKKELADRCLKLEEITKDLKNEITEKENLLLDLENLKSSSESFKQIIQESEGIIIGLKNELSLAKNDKDQIMVEIENLRRKENCKLDSLFEVFDESQRILLEILSSALPSFDGEEEKSLLVYKNIEDKLSNPQFLSESTNTKFLSFFIKSVVDCCKLVKEELNKEFTNEKTAWETKRNSDLSLIENLQSEVKHHEKNKNEHETKMYEITSERDKLRNLCDSLKVQLSQAESNITTRDEEIRILQSHDFEMKQTRDELASARETVKKLEAQIVTVESEKKELADQCLKLEEMTTSLKIEIAAKESLLRDLENVKSSLDEAQNENESLKKVIEDLEGSIADLKNELSLAKNDKNQIMVEMENLRSKENCKLDSLFEVFDESQKILLEILSSALPSFDGEEEESLMVYKNIEDKLSNPQFLSESTNTKFLSFFIKSVVDCCKLVKEELNKEFTNEKTVWETKRNSDLALIENLQREIRDESEKKEIADQCLKLEEMTTSLNIEIAAKENLLRDLEEVKSSFDEAQNENESLKKLIQDLEGRMADLKNELSLADSDKEKILSEVENLRNKENYKLENLFEIFDKTNKILIDILSNTLPCFDDDENEFRLIYENIEKNLSNPQFLSESINTKFLSLFTKSVTDCCKRVMEGLKKEFSSEKLDWESRRNLDLTLIENLQNRIKIQEEKEEEQEVKISEITLERNELAKLCGLLKEQLSQAENNICARNEEIRILQSNDSNMKRTREELASAKETILKLESKISVAESEKVVIENRCQELEEGTTNLKNEIAAKEYLLRDLEKLKLSFDNAQSDIEILKKLIQESEGIIIGLKNELSAVKKEKDELIMEIESLRLKENRKLDSLFDVFVECDKMLMDVVSNTTSWFDEEDEGYRLVHENVEKNLSYPEFLSDSRNTKFVSLFTKSVIDCCRHVREELRKEFSREKADWETRKKAELTATENLENQIKSLNEQLFSHEGKLKEFEDLKIMFDSLKEKMCENESLILNREEEIRILKSHDSNMKRTQADLASAKETIVKLETEISLAEAGRKEVEDRCQKLEEGTRILKNEMAAKENLVRDFESLKFSLDNAQSDNANLKQLIRESEGVISELRIELSVAKNDNEKIMLEMENLRIEENCKLDNLFKIFDESQKILMEVMSNALTCFDGGENEGSIYENVEKNLSNPKFLSDSTNTKFLSLFTKSVVDCCKLVKELLRKDFNDQKIDWETKRNVDLKQIENLQSLIRGHEENKDKREAKISEITSERNEFKKLCDTLREKLSKAENIISNRDEEILALKDQDDLLRQMKNSPSVMEKVVAHINKLEAKANELKAENAKLDEECDSYAKTIKELKKEAVLVWKSNKEKTESMEAEISRLKEEKNVLEKEKQELLDKITKLDKECEKLKSGLKSEGSLHACSCGNELKKINDLRRTILMREQKILELRDLETQNSLYKSQIEYLENALEREKKKISEEKQKNKKLQNELNEATKNHKAEEKKSDESNMLEELRMRGSVSGGVVQEFVDKEKMRKLSKDIGILKELCRARYAEIKRLETENAALRKATPKNSIQMDSPLRTKAYNTRSKNTVKDLWKPDIIGKENVAL